MLTKAEQIIDLFKKHLRDELSEAERIALDELIASDEVIRQLFEGINSEDEIVGKLKQYYSESRSITDDDMQKAFKRAIEPAIVVPMQERRRAYPRWTAAAAVVLFVAFGIYFWQTNRQSTIAKTENKQPIQKEIMPADGFAILVLDDGRKIILDSAGNGVIASNGGKDIVKEDGQISYQGKSKEVVYNTLVTSKGKVTRLPLADGSMVWLNAESSIRFPTEFPGDERVVEITGEVNFEVAKNAKKPFRVIVQTPAGKKAEVEVLGTHFNVNAYIGEATIQTTLIEGKVKISELTNKATKILAPGQQALIDITGNINVTDNVNTEAILAWKNNDFYFKSNDIKTIMRQLARWYDITVSYQTDLPGRTFSGQISRNRNLSDVLEILKKANVHFSIKGREVTVIQ